MKKALFFIFLIATNFNSVSQNCSVDILIFQNQGECVGTMIQLIASPVNAGNVYQWSCPNQSYNSTNGPFLYIPNSTIVDNGNYTLTITDSNGCIASKTISVSVVPKPTVIITGQSFACLGSVTQLSAYDASGNYGPYTYSWDNGKSTSSINILHNGGTGPHPSCIITNSSGCSATNQTSFMIGTIYPPFAEITYNGLTSFCSPLNLELNAPVGGQFFYQWRKSGVNINGATNSTYKAASTGRFKVIVSDIYGCSDTSDFVQITVFPRPSAAVSASGSLTFCNGDSVTLTAPAGSGYVYHWKKNGVFISGATNMTYVVKNSGNYKVAITSNQDCFRLSELKTININCKDGEDMPVSDGSLTEIIAYPNPSNDHFTLRLSQNSNSESVVDVFDMLGHRVHSFQANIEGDDMVFGHALAPGMYSARITQNGTIRVIKLVKN